MPVAAHKVRGIRAALVHDEVTARTAREKNHCNVLCLGTDLLSEDQIRNIVEIFLATPWTDGRHTERVKKVMAIRWAAFCFLTPRRRRPPSFPPATTAPPAAPPGR